MSQECFPNHPTSIGGAKKLRLKIITSNGRRFICPVAYECTVEELADRILKIYTQFQKDPTHRYYSTDNKVAKRIYNIRSHSYHLGRTDYVADLVNDLDEIECDVEEVDLTRKAKENDRKKHRKNKTKNTEATSDNTEIKLLTKPKDEPKKQEMPLQQIPKTHPLPFPHENTQPKKLSVDVISQSRASPKLPIMDVRCSPKPQFLQKHSPRVQALDNPPPILKEISMSLKKSHEKDNERKQYKNQHKLTYSPKPAPLESKSVEKLEKPVERTKHKEREKEGDKDTKDKGRYVIDRESKEVKQSKEGKQVRENRNKEGRPPQVQQEQGVRERKRSCIVMETEEQKQSQSVPVYSKKHVQANRKKIFNRFDDDDE